MTLTERILADVAQHPRSRPRDVADRLEAPRHRVASILSNLHAQGRVVRWEGHYLLPSFNEVTHAMIDRALREAGVDVGTPPRGLIERIRVLGALAAEEQEDDVRRERDELRAELAEARRKRSAELRELAALRLEVEAAKLRAERLARVQREDVAQLARAVAARHAIDNTDPAWVLATVSNRLLAAEAGREAA